MQRQQDPLTTTVARPVHMAYSLVHLPFEDHASQGLASDHSWLPVIHVADALTGHHDV